MAKYSEKLKKQIKETAEITGKVMEARSIVFSIPADKARWFDVDGNELKSLKDIYEAYHKDGEIYACEDVT